MTWLPTGSAYATSIGQDDELIAEEKRAEEAAKEAGLPVPTSSRRPSAVGWGDLRSDLADVKDLMNHLIAVTAQADKAPQPIPRPEFAIDRWERNWRDENTNWLYQAMGISPDDL